jgi:hypothetical protein
LANYGATFTASHAAGSASVESIIHKRGMQKNNLLSIVALVALAIANNNGVIGIMTGVVIAEVVNIIISGNEEE